VVTAIAATAEMAASGVRPGMEVVDVDGRPAARVIEDEYQYVGASTHKIEMHACFRWCSLALPDLSPRCGCAQRMAICVTCDSRATSPASADTVFETRSARATVIGVSDLRYPQWFPPLRPGRRDVAD
jgi:hypothetical protein